MITRHLRWVKNYADPLSNVIAQTDEKKGGGGPGHLDVIP